MQFKIFAVILAVMFMFNLSLAKDPQYVGADKCKSCHKADKNGAQFKIWSESKHANAYKSLTSKNAAAKAEAMGVKDPLKDDTCLACHTTAHGKKNVDKSYSMEEGVSCEACHGPGGDYKKTKVMKDKKEAQKAGLLVADDKTCANCHKKDTKGHENKFTTFENEIKKIAHPVPAESDRRKQ